MKEHRMFIFFLLKINAKKLIIKKINNESVNPNTEFSIMYGENTKKHAPTIEISFLKIEASPQYQLHWALYILHNQSTIMY